MKAPLSSLAIGAAILVPALAIDLDLTQESSVDAALSAIAYDMMTFYKGNQTGEVPGVLPGPCAQDDCYYWWMAGGMWGTLANYYGYTGDASYQPTALQALAFQVGPDKNYMPPNQSANAFSEDAVFWALAALAAMEAGVPDLADGTTPSWLALAAAVFDSHALAWDTESCGGGLRWAVFSFESGYNLKNSISTGAFFQLAARLAWHTGNATYATWADTAYDWLASSALMQTQNDTLYVWDSVDTNDNCAVAQNYVWTYNYGTLLAGAALMYNHTAGNDTWRGRVDTLLAGATAVFFPDGGDVLSEILCEDLGNCNNDQSSFKAYTARWMAETAVLAPFTAAQITPKLAASAQGAARQCSGGDNGRMCGRQWYSDEWDGSSGVGQQMSALAVIGATRINAGSLVQKGGATGTGNSSSSLSSSSSSSSAPSSSSSSSSSPAATRSSNGSAVLAAMLKMESFILAGAVGLLAHVLF